MQYTDFWTIFIMSSTENPIFDEESVISCLLETTSDDAVLAFRNWLDNISKGINAATKIVRISVWFAKTLSDLCSYF
jgi:hypothetical protein